jgi:type I restriction enzyme M protein
MTVLSPSATQIEGRIDKIFDHLYANAPVRTPKGIAYEAGKILHTAMFMEAEHVNSPAFNFNKGEQRRLDAGDRELVALVARDCRRKFAAMNKTWELYPAKEQLALGDFDLAFVCNCLSGVLVSDKKRDVFGDALEIFRYEWVKRNGGQFFTDQRVTHLAVALLQFNPLQGDDLVDICAGTGGFLLAGLNALQQAAAKSSLTESKIIALAQRSLKGQEADPELAEVCRATLTARLGNEHSPDIIHGNSLFIEAFDSRGKHGIRFGQHTCAATNPPFGTKITVKDPHILRNYELAYANHDADLLLSARFSPKAPDILFIEQNLKLLKPGIGRLAIVVPYQIMSGPQTLFVRNWILKNAKVLAVVDLPGETFQPHTGTKACLLVLQRRERPLAFNEIKDDHNVFMSMPRWIGHDRRGNPVYKRNADGTFSDEVLSDFADVGEAYHAFLRGEEPKALHPESFIVPAKQIFADPALRLNAQFHQPHSAEHAVFVSHGKLGSRHGWQTVRLGDVVTRVFYPGRFKRNYVDPSETATPFLGGTNISQLLINTDKWVNASQAVAQELCVEPGWVLVTRSGSTGIISSVPKAWKGYAISEHVIRIIPDDKKLPGEYILAFLRTSYAQEALAKGVYGSVIDEINPEYLCDLEVPVPPKEIVARIVQTVRAGEEARDNAIQGLLEGVEQLEAAMKGSAKAAASGVPS